MKTVTLANQKGGVGKSAVAVQLAYFIALVLKKRVLVIDLDHQRNTTKALRVGELATVSALTSSQLLKEEVTAIEAGNLVLVGGDGDLIRMEKQPAEHNAFATNLMGFVDAVADQFDVCVIDTNPNPDIRQLSALISSDFVLSPIQLNQEAIDGIGDLLNHENIGVRKIKATLNPKLELIGILPNIVEPTPFQRENMTALGLHYAKLLIPLPKPTGGFANVKKSTAIPEAQALGLPVWKVPKTSAREAWAAMKPTFEKIAAVLGATA